MTELFETDPLVIRTGFKSKTSWDDLVELIRKLSWIDFRNDPEWKEYVRFIPHNSDPNDVNVKLRFVDRVDIAKQAIETVISSLADNHAVFVFIADDQSFEEPEHSLLVVSVEDPAIQFRTVPRQIFSVVSNLTLRNMDFQDFQASCDKDGVFRG